MKGSNFIPETGPFARLSKQTKILSSEALNKFMMFSKNARERARPFFERAYRSAERAVNDMILKARPQP